MTTILFLVAILASHLRMPASSGPIPSPRYARVMPDGNFQDNKPLTRAQIEELLIRKLLEDDQLAAHVLDQGIAFRLGPDVLDGLVKLGAGEKTKQALLQKAEDAAYAEFSNETLTAKWLELGREFLRTYPVSAHAPKVKAALRKVELDVFESEFQEFSRNPGAPGLNRVLMHGRQLLDQSPDPATGVRVTSMLALATGKGRLNNFYEDLEQSRAYANQALKQLEAPAPPPGMDQSSFDQLRTGSLSIIYQSLGLYLLQQSDADDADTEQAIRYLTKAAEMKGSPGASDPVTYWLRANARNQNYQKTIAAYHDLPKAQRAGRPGRALCEKITELSRQLIRDYTLVLTFSGPASSSQPKSGQSLASQLPLSQLNDEATKALELLYKDERPCADGRSGLVDEWPGEEKRFALVIGVEEYVDKRLSKFNYAASDARAVAAGLVRQGAFRKDQVVVLATGESADRQPWRSVILQQLAELSSRAKQDGLLLVYFAGQVLEGGGKNYLLATDSLTDLLSDSAISLEQFKDRIRTNGVGQVMLIFDSFRRTPVSESFSRQLSFDVRKDEATAFAMLLSASTGQRAYESQQKKQGVFTAAFLEAIKGKAADQSQRVTLDGLIKYLQTTVPQEALRESGIDALQQPVDKVDGYDAGNLVMFAPGSNEQPPDLAKLVRDSKTIQIRSKTVYMKDPAVLEAELRKLPQFQASKLKFVHDLKEADLIVEITLPFMTWEWNYTVIHRASNKILVSGKRRGLTDDSVSPGLANELITKLFSLRDSPQKK